MANLNKHRAASREAWATFLRSRFETCVHEGFEDAIVKRVNLADLELEVMEERVVFARQQRNKVMGACRLPPEVLSAVFAHVQEIWSPMILSISPDVVNGQRQDIEASYSSGWMSLLHVCSFWRQTALGDSSLWCNILCMDVHPGSMPTLLARSRGLPLSLHINGACLSTENDEVLQVDFSALWSSKAILRRTKRLVLDNVPDHRLQLWLRNLHYPMPLLEIFKITNPRRKDGEIVATLPDELFAYDAPVLRNVTMTATNLHWDCTTLLSANLVHLSLGFDDRTPEDVMLASAPTTERFYQVLSSMKNLESLTLRDVFPASTREGHPPAETVEAELPNLKQLTMFASTDFLTVACIDFFQRLLFPSQTRVILDLDPETHKFNYHDDLPTHMVKLFGPAESAAPTSMCFSVFTIVMEYSNASSIQDTLRNDVPYRHQERLADIWEEYKLGTGARGIWMVEDDEDYTIFSLLQSLPLRTLQTIAFTSDVSNINYVVESPYWWGIFRAAPNVQGISVRYHDALVLFDALSASSHWLLFPRLSTIALHANPVASEEDLSETLAKLRTSLDVLMLDMLHVRREKGAPVETLLVSQALAGWDVWRRVGDLVHVEFF
ncbi:hypothetical protein PENSPDRAFT_758253 [Peniophora sp. CONT]|nr:hypothetical protein PENSPDRAFT_758253 [Peniophora sp. CONT]